MLPRLGAAICFLAVIPVANGTILPISYDLKEIDRIPNPVDDGLAEWKRLHDEVPPLNELKPVELAALVDRLDQTSRAFVQLRLENSTKGSQGKALKEALVHLENAQAQNIDIVSAHPLGPYLLEEVLEADATPPQVADWAHKALYRAEIRSCPQRDAIIREIAEEKLAQLDLSNLLEMLTRIQGYRDNNFREEAFESLLAALSKDHQDALRSTIIPLVKDFSKLIQNNDWLFGDDEKQSLGSAYSDSQDPLIAEMEYNVRKRRCNSAEQKFAKYLTRKETSPVFTDAEKLGRKIENCFRRFGYRSRVKFWERSQDAMGKVFGFSGYELARRRQGAVLWSVDEFADAVKIFKEIRDLASKEGYQEEEGEAINTLARIEENRGDFEKSMDHYIDYFKRFPNAPERLRAIVSLILLKAVVNDPVGALKYADYLIDEQSALDIDDRSTYALSFALFWAGRLRLAIGDRSQAIEMWRRVASEFYSTYYGALGHYMLERIADKSYALQPSRTGRFNLNTFHQSFAAADRQVLARTEALLRIGLRNEASCELSEIDAGSNQASLAMRSLLEHATGNWLQAIKTYDGLTRSFRNGLPVGFERILFPRRYDDAVKRYAESAGVEPELVFAIIRQESVFNRKARSPAGARGLMQLMPFTARSEAKRLKRGYVGQNEASLLKKRSRNNQWLLDADVNLAIGVHHVSSLMRRYKNPVFTLTSYNANPRATKRWAENIPTDDFLVFVERIPYQETRNYVKLVMRNYFYYKRWYEEPIREMAMLDQLLKVDVARVSEANGSLKVH